MVNEHVHWPVTRSNRRRACFAKSQTKPMNTGYFYTARALTPKDTPKDLST